MNSNVFGATIETIFMLEAASRGLQVRRPVTTEAYDLIVETPKGPITVQVKGTRKVRNRRGDLFCRVRLTRHSRRAPHYATAGVDFLAAYAVPWEQWYFVPLAGRTSSWLELRRKPSGSLKRTVNNWKQLRKRRTSKILLAPTAK